MKLTCKRRLLGTAQPSTTRWDMRRSWSSRRRSRGVEEEHRYEPGEGRGVLEGHQTAKASVSEDDIAGVQCQTYRQCNQQTKGKNKQAQRKCESNPRVQSAKRSPCNAYGDTHTTRCIACFSLSYHGRAVTNNMQRVCARVRACARECTCVCMNA